MRSLPAACCPLPAARWIASASIRRISSSTPRVNETGADPPKAALNLTPLYCAGLWLAVITTAPAARKRTTAYEKAGVGANRSARLTRTPSAAIASAAAWAKSRERNRVSYPTTMCGGDGSPASASTRRAMARATRRTLSNVTSAAMMPRQPSVPNWIFVMSPNSAKTKRRVNAAYSAGPIPTRQGKSPPATRSAAGRLRATRTPAGRPSPRVGRRRASRNR